MDHRLVGVRYIPTPNVGGKLVPEAIVIHYTAGRSADRAIATLTSKTHKASAHVVIGADGRATQLAPFNVQTWHAGTSVWDGRKALNKWSVGIELDNPGWLKGGPGAWRTWFGAPVSDDDVIVSAHKNRAKVLGWKRFPESQIAACYAVCAALCDTYPRIRLFLGHDDIAPERKLDPGPAFPAATLRAWLGLDGPTK